MAAKLYGGPITITVTAQSMTTGLSLSPRLSMSTFALRADKANVGDVWVGKSNVTITTNQLGYLRPGEALTIDLNGKYINTDDIFFIGTNADKVYVLNIQ